MDLSKCKISFYLETCRKEWKYSSTDITFKNKDTQANSNNLIWNKGANQFKTENQFLKAYVGL